MKNMGSDCGSKLQPLVQKAAMKIQGVKGSGSGFNKFKKLKKLK
jgi:hypothetical protein